MFKNCDIILITTLMLCNNVNGEFLQYFRTIGTYFGYGKQQPAELEDFLAQKVPYEVSIPDQKFISEAAKLTDVALSELDSCQHRVVLKLQTSCDKMNDEQLAKMAVMLLNCQSAVEGRKIYPCTDTMSIKDCTSSMDADVWNSYHLISNRARAVCYSVRQIQFRGLTEHTVNKLMDAARTQLFNLEKISKDQENLHNMAESSLSTVAEGQKNLIQQQSDFQRAQFYGQLQIEDNIRRLADEKHLILEAHDELTKMTRDVQGKLLQASEQLESQMDENRVNHRELLDDLMAIQNKAQTIFQRIEESTDLLIKQSEITRVQYEATIAQLTEVNTTVHALVNLIGGTRKALEERLLWLSTALGGTDLAVERLYLIVWHAGFLLFAMVSCAFLGARITTRFIVATVPPLNLAVALQQSSQALDPVSLCLAIGSLILVQNLLYFLISLKQNKNLQGAIPWIKEKLTPQKRQSPTQNSLRSSYVNESSPCLDTQLNGKSNIYTSSSAQREINDNEEIDSFDFNSPISPILKNGHYTPRSRSRTPLNLNGSFKGTCSAITRMGTPCKLSSLPGRDRCYRHQSGDSIFAG